MQKLNTENLIVLFKILDEADDNDLLMKAEIFRQLSWFDESRQLLNRMSNADLALVKEKLLVEISRQNDQVFRLYWECNLEQIRAISTLIPIECDIADLII